MRLRTSPSPQVILCGSGLATDVLDELITAWRCVVHPSQLLVTVAPGQPQRPAVREVRQPADRGTAPEVLLALLPELVEDPEALFAIITDPRDRPGAIDDLSSPFIEAASAGTALRLRRRGSGIVLGTGTALLRLFGATVPALLRLLTYYVEMPAGERAAFLELAYRDLPPVDFDADVLAPAGAAGLIRDAGVLRALACSTGRCRTRRSHRPQRGLRPLAAL